MVQFSAYNLILKSTLFPTRVLKILNECVVDLSQKKIPISIGNRMSRCLVILHFLFKSGSMTPNGGEPFSYATYFQYANEEPKAGEGPLNGDLTNSK